MHETQNDKEIMNNKLPVFLTLHDKYSVIADDNDN